MVVEVLLPGEAPACVAIAALVRAVERPTAVLAVDLALVAGEVTQRGEVLLVAVLACERALVRVNMSPRRR